MSKKTTKSTSMQELLAALPDTGITKGKASLEAAEYVAAHPETWTPVYQAKRGRPRRGQETGSRPKSIRFPDEDWSVIEAKAKRLNLPLHAALRKALLDWATAPDVPVKTASHPTTVVVVQMPPVTVPPTLTPQPDVLSLESNTPSFEKFFDLVPTNKPTIRRI